MNWIVYYHLCNLWGSNELSAVVHESPYNLDQLWVLNYAEPFIYLLYFISVMLCSDNSVD